MPESGTIFVGSKGKMWCETYSESPRLIPESAMAAFNPRPPKTLPRVPEGGPVTRRTGWMRSGRRGRRCRTDYAARLRKRCCSETSLLHPGTRLMWLRRA